MEKAVKITASQVQLRLRQRPPAGMCHRPGKTLAPRNRNHVTVKNSKKQIYPKAKCLTNLKPEIFLQNPEMHIEVLHEREKGREE